MGRSALTSKYAHLFTSNLDTLLTQDAATKKKWLVTVWSARENQSGVLTHRDPNIPHNNFFLRWRIQADPDQAVAERRQRQRQAMVSRRIRRIRGERTGRQPCRSRSIVVESGSSGSESDMESDQGE